MNMALTTTKITAVAAVLMLAFGSAYSIAGDGHDHGPAQANSQTQAQTPAETQSALFAADSDHQIEDHDHDDTPHQESGDHQHGNQADVHDDDHGHGSESDVHGEEEEGHDHSEEGLHLSAQQSAMAGIVVSTVVESHFNFTQPIPAQLLTNPNLTSQLSLPVDARVVARHVNPGQEVHQGDALLTLASSAIADAQGQYLLAEAEWQRVQSLGKKAISASRFQQARIDVETSLQNLLALGMTQTQIDKLNKPSTRLGQFTLLAPHGGTVQQDNSVMQQNLPALTPLMVLTNEKVLWANAQLSPSQSGSVHIGQTLSLQVEDQLYQAKVIGRDHQLDAQTRTESLRLEVQNPDHRLHVGQFATAYLCQNHRTGIVVPDSALSRGADGDWVVYLYDGESYQATEVTVLDSMAKQNLIAGIPMGSQVVTEGAFFLTSELNKSGLDIHNH